MNYNQFANFFFFTAIIAIIALILHIMTHAHFLLCVSVPFLTLVLVALLPPR